MDGFRVFILAMQSAEAVVFIAAGIPLALRKVPPNGLYGLRVRRTLRDPATWYDANAHSGRVIVVAGIVIAAVGLGLYFVPRLDGSTYAWACLATTLLAVAWAMAESLRFLDRLPR